MKAYLSTRAFIPLFLLTYFWGSFFGIFAQKYEIFPVFNWSLFSIVRDEMTLVDVEVLAIDGEALPKPTRYYDLGDKFAQAARKNIMFQKLLAFAGRAHGAGDGRKFEELKDVLETTYLSGHDEVRYRIVVGRFNPIVRWQSAQINDMSMIGEYVYREPK